VRCGELSQRVATSGTCPGRGVEGDVWGHTRVSSGEARGASAWLKALEAEGTLYGVGLATYVPSSTVRLRVGFQPQQLRC
jgi:hypothetical protein